MYLSEYSLTKPPDVTFGQLVSRYFDRYIRHRTWDIPTFDIRMPELPDILLYIESLRPRIVGEQLERVRLASPFLLRSVTPPISSLNGRVVRGLRRLGKQIVLEFEGDLFLVIHLMIAWRLQWKKRGAPVPAPLRR